MGGVKSTVGTEGEEEALWETKGCGGCCCENQDKDNEHVVLIQMILHPFT
jgi:hypothetical protein